MAARVGGEDVTKLTQKLSPMLIETKEGKRYHPVVEVEEKIPAFWDLVKKRFRDPFVQATILTVLCSPIIIAAVFFIVMTLGQELTIVILSSFSIFLCFLSIFFCS